MKLLALLPPLRGLLRDVDAACRANRWALGRILRAVAHPAEPAERPAAAGQETRP